jgi:hypothetical protein
MKIVLIVVGVLTLLCCAGGGAVLYFGGKKALDVAGEGKQFGDESLRAIAMNWSLEELERRAAPELIEQAGRPALKNITDTLGPALGPIKTFESSIHGINAQSTTETGTYTEVKYTANAEFEKSKGIVDMTLLKRGDKWEILAFNGRRTQ